MRATFSNFTTKFRAQKQIKFYFDCNFMWTWATVFGSHFLWWNSYLIFNESSLAFSKNKERFGMECTMQWMEKEMNVVSLKFANFMATTMCPEFITSHCSSSFRNPGIGKGITRSLDPLSLRLGMSVLSCLSWYGFRHYCQYEGKYGKVTNPRRTDPYRLHFYSTAVSSGLRDGSSPWHTP